MNNNLFIVWSDCNQSGIKIIDEQHRGIVSTINSLYYYMNAGEDNDVLKAILVTLEQYTYIHFKTEEELMAQANCPNLEEHIELHRTLYKSTKKINVDAIMNKDSIMVLKMLKTWWIEHINNKDKESFSFLKTLL